MSSFICNNKKNIFTIIDNVLVRKKYNCLFRYNIDYENFLCFENRKKKFAIIYI